VRTTSELSRAIWFAAALMVATCAAAWLVDRFLLS
jgi:hypothetical protein